MSVKVPHLKQNDAPLERERRFDGFALASVMTGLLLTLLLESLDQTIVSTAAPRIMSQLQGFDRYTWVVTAYLLASTTIIPIVSKLSDQFGRKWLLIAGVVIFLLGSALSGASQTMDQLIIFRTVQGVGAGICLALVFVVVGDIFPPAKRAKWQGVFSAVYGLSSVAGPTIGGWLTDNGPLLGNLVTNETRWRWVFYINLPLGAVALLALLVYLPANLHKPRQVGKVTLRNIDVLGALLAAAATICLLLGLTWGGAYGWGSSLVISLLVAAGLLFIAFGFAERFAAEPILPLHLLRNQIFAADAVLSLLIGMILFGSVVYLPLFLQGGLGESAINSGALLTPMTFSVVIGATISGLTISALKRYQAVTIVGGIVMGIGLLLLSRMSLATSLLVATLSMAVAGIGIGMVFSVLTLVVQNAIPRSLMGVGTGAVNYLRQLGGALGVAIIGTVFNNTFSSDITQRLPGDIVSRLPAQGVALLTDPQVLINDAPRKLIVQMVGSDAAQHIFDGLRLSLTTATQLSLTTVLLLCIATIVAASFLKDIPLATRFSNEAGGSAEHAVDIDLRSQERFSKGTTTSQSRIHRVRLVPLEKAQRLQQVAGVPRVEGVPKAQGVATDERERRSTYRVGLAYGRQVYRLRWLILVLWVVALLVSLPFSGKLSSVLKSGGLTLSSSDSAHVSDIAINKLHVPPSQLLAVFHSAQTPVADPTYQSEIHELTRRAQTLSVVTSVIPGGTGADGQTAYVIINMNQSLDAMQQHFSIVRTALIGQPLLGPAQVYLTGDIAVYDEINQLSQTETEQADGAALPIALVVLLLVFASFVAAVTPILLTLVVVPITLAIIYAIAQQTDMNAIVLTIASIIGLGLSIDYSLLFVRRFREELAYSRATHDAVAWTIATSGEAILFSGLTVMIGFSALLILDIPFMTSFGIGGAIVVGVAVLGALTLLPAFLGILGPRINALRLPWIGRLLQPAQRTTTSNGTVIQECQGLWYRWALIVMRHPVLILVLVCALLLGLGWPALQMEIGVPTASSLPSSSQARQGLDLLHAQFPATNDDPIYIIAQTPDGSRMLVPNNLTRLDQLTRWLQQQEHITGVTSLTHLPDAPGTPTPTLQQLILLYSTDTYEQKPQLAQFVNTTTANDTTLVTVHFDPKLDSKTSGALIDTLRAGDLSAAQGLTVLVGGFQANTLDFDRYLYSRFPEAIAFILAATYILLLLMFRSVLLPLKAILMNVLSISVSYGVLVYVFQWGNFQDLLGFTSTGFLDSTLPVLTFCILFGLSMDYEVFLLSRIREEWLVTNNNRYSVARGLEKTGSVITSAALLFAIVAGAITFTSLLSTKEIGLGITVAILVDATIIRSLLVPATMRLLGRWNWWLPGRPLPQRPRWEP